MGDGNTTLSAGFRKSNLLERAGFRHAFFTRTGGVSEGPFASLNFSISVGDDPDHVNGNLARASRVLAVDPARVYFLSQVHGAETRVIRGDEPRGEVLLLEGDALVGTNPKCAVGVRIADCLPILVGDRKSGATVAIHAGWKGLVAGIVESGIRRLQEVAGTPGELVAAIGPHITARAFEVSEDVAIRLAESVPGAGNVIERHHGPRPHVNLCAVARARLERIGLERGDVDVVPGCTHGEPESFFSFRRDGARSGRHLAAIVPRG